VTLFHTTAVSTARRWPLLTSPQDRRDAGMLTFGGGSTLW
jgi:hypothetical protein